MYRSGSPTRSLGWARIAHQRRGRNSNPMSASTISALHHPGPGQTIEVVRAMAFAATFPVRLLLHYSSPSPPSRPMAAALVPSQSREWDEPTRAGHGIPALSVVPGRLAS